MPIDLRNIGAISPNGTGAVTVTHELKVTGDVDITGTPAPVYRINGVPIGSGGVSSISPGSLTGAVTLQAGANVSITQAGQAITIASTGGGSGSSQWIDIAGGGIYYGGGNVGISTANPGSLLSFGATAANITQRIALFELPGGAAFRGIGMANPAPGLYGVGIYALASPVQTPSDANMTLFVADTENVGIGTSTPSTPLTVSGPSNAPSYSSNCGVTSVVLDSGLQLAMGGINAVPYPFYLQTKHISNAGGAFPLLLNPVGSNVVIGTTAPFDPGNPHLQVMSGLTVNSMADNGIANLRLVGPNPTYGIIFRNDDAFFAIMSTNAWDAYGTWKTVVPMTIELATGCIGLRVAPDTNYGVSVDSINANNIYRQGVEIVPPPSPSAGWHAYTPTILDGSGTPVAVSVAFGRYSVFASWCTIMINIQFDPRPYNQTTFYIQPPPVSFYQGPGGVAFAAFCYGDPNFRVAIASYLAPWINVNMTGNLPTPAALVQISLSGVAELQA